MSIKPDKDRLFEIELKMELMMDCMLYRMFSIMIAGYCFFGDFHLTIQCMYDPLYFGYFG